MCQKACCATLVYVKTSKNTPLDSNRENMGARTGARACVYLLPKTIPTPWNDVLERYPIPAGFYQRPYIWQLCYLKNVEIV